MSQNEDGPNEVREFTHYRGEAGPRKGRVQTGYVLGKKVEL